MLEIIRKKIVKNSRGAIDKIIVTLLLVIISVSAMVGLSIWAKEQERIMKERTSTAVEEATLDAAGG